MKIKNILIVFLIILPIAAYSQLDTTLYQTETSKNVSAWLKDLSVPTGQGHVSISDWQFGGIIISMNSQHYVDSFGMSAYYGNTTLLNNDLNLAGKNLRRDFRKMQQAGANMVRCPSLIPWGVVEPSQGIYHYEFIDSTVKIAGIYKVKVLGTVVPLADWSQTCNPVNNNCNIFTSGGGLFFLNENKTGPVCTADTSYFYQFVQQTVERYDGDGNSDMPGLTQPVTVWEFTSEPESPCGNYSASYYERDLDIFKRAMKAACPTCKLLIGGWAGYLQDSSFFKTVIQDKHSDIDIGNIHCNEGRSSAPFSFTNMIYKQTNIFQKQINQLALEWNIWLTEWGIYCGQPGVLPLRTEEEEASIYTKIYCWSLANNITDIFYDLKTVSNPLIGSASLLQEKQCPQDSLFARLFFYTQKLLEYKFCTYDSVKVVQIDTSTNIPKGDIRFYKAGSTHYVLWGLNSLPLEINGIKNITDIYGNITTINVSSLSLPLGANPLIIEDTVSTTASNEFSLQNQISIFPNPFSTQTILRTTHDLKDATLTISNMIGQEIKIIKNISGQEIKIDRDNLSCGIYIICLMQDNIVITKNKLLITN